jgi:hypothetical protein
VLLNLSNHPSDAWGAAQRAAAERFGGVRDVPFPAVPPDAADVSALARAVVERLRADPARDVVHVMGELTLCFAVVARLQRAGVRCVASTSARRVAVDPRTGAATRTFAFIRFRSYPSLRA